MSAAAVSPSWPRTVAKYQTGTTMPTTRLPQVTFSSNGMAASSPQSMSNILAIANVRRSSHHVKHSLH